MASNVLLLSIPFAVSSTSGSESSACLRTLDKTHMLGSNGFGRREGHPFSGHPGLDHTGRKELHCDKLESECALEKTDCRWTDPHSGDSILPGSLSCPSRQCRDVQPSQGCAVCRPVVEQTQSQFQSYGFNDCANYVSQCLIAGGLSLRASPSVDKSGSIAQCSSLDTFLTKTLKATVWRTSSSARPPTALQPGDVAIFGNWLGLTHAVFVSAKQTNGQPLFNAHTYDRKRTTLGWLFSSWTYIKYYHIVKSPITVAAAPRPATPPKTAVVTQPPVTTRSSMPATALGPKLESVDPGVLATTLAPSSVTSSSAVLNGIIRPDGEPALWFYEYGVSETYSCATDRQGPLLGNMTYNVDIAVTELKPGTLYHARLVRGGNGWPTHDRAGCHIPNPRSLTRSHTEGLTTSSSSMPPADSAASWRAWCSTPERQRRREVLTQDRQVARPGLWHTPGKLH